MQLRSCSSKHGSRHLADMLLMHMMPKHLQFQQVPDRPPKGPKHMRSCTCSKDQEHLQAPDDMLHAAVLSISSSRH
jgi:hypothetical protein